MYLASLIPQSCSEISTPSNHERFVHRPLKPKQPNRQTAQLSLLKDSHIGDNKIVASLSYIVINFCHSGISIRKKFGNKKCEKDTTYDLRTNAQDFKTDANYLWVSYHLNALWLISLSESVAIFQTLRILQYRCNYMFYFN